MDNIYQINIGCGITPTPGFLNFDNSFGVRLAKHPWLTYIIKQFGFLDENQDRMIFISNENDVQWADASKHIPLSDDSVDVLYSSHMLEHLDREEVIVFLKEARRILISGGIIRLVVPDIKKLVNKYLVDGDANEFIARTYLAYQRPRNFRTFLQHLVVGSRHHLWMYDEDSLIKLLLENGFNNSQAQEPGKTMISNPAELNLYERASESICIEAVK